MKLCLLFFIPIIVSAHFLNEKIAREFNVKVLSRNELLDKDFMSKFVGDTREKFFLSKDGGIIELQKLHIKKGTSSFETFGEKRIHKSRFGFIAKKGFKEKLVWNILTSQKTQRPCQPPQRGYASQTFKYTSIDNKFNYFFEEHLLQSKREGCLKEARKKYLFLEKDNKCILLQSQTIDCFGNKKEGGNPLGNPIGVLSYKDFNILLLASDDGIVALYFQNGSVVQVKF